MSLSQETSEMMSTFKYEHLPENLQVISKPFCLLAQDLVKNLPCNYARRDALKKLMEAKDNAVRSCVASGSEEFGVDDSMEIWNKLEETWNAVEQIKGHLNL